MVCFLQGFMVFGTIVFEADAFLCVFIVVLQRGADSAVTHILQTHEPLPNWTYPPHTNTHTHTDVLSVQTPPFAMTAGLLLPVLVPVQWRPICAGTCPSLGTVCSYGTNLLINIA